MSVDIIEKETSLTLLFWVERSLAETISMRLSIHLLWCFFANSRTEDSSTPPAHSSNVTFSLGSIVDLQTLCVDPSIGVHVVEVSDSGEEIWVQRQPPLMLLIRHHQLKRFKGTVSSYSQYFHIRISDASGTHSAIGADGLKVWADEDDDDSPEPALDSVLRYGNPFGYAKMPFRMPHSLSERPRGCRGGCSFANE
jgi:hypothetical protein